METFTWVSDKELIDGIEIWARDESGMSRPINLSLQSKDKREKLFMSPVYFLRGNGSLRRVFESAMQVIADPDKVEPKRPVGHTYEVYPVPPARWIDEDLEFRLQQGVHMDVWKEYLDDGGSKYFEFNSEGRRYILHKAKGSGRVLVGQEVQVNLPIQWQDQSQILSYKLIQRYVAVEGRDYQSKGYSPEGSTNFKFGGFILGI